MAKSGGSSVLVDFDADASGLAREQKALLKRLDQMDRKLNRVSSASRRSGRAAKQMGQEATAGAMSFVKAIAGIGATLGGIHVVVSQLRREYENIVRRQREAAQATMTADESRAAALYNRPGDVPVKFIETLVGQAADKHKVDQNVLWQAMGSGLSAKGELSNAQFASAFMQMARLRRAGGTSIDMPMMLGGVLDVMKKTGVPDARQAMGWTRQVGAQMRITEASKQLDAVAKVVGAGNLARWEPETSAELVSYITQASADPTGESSRTAAIAFMSRMASGEIKIPTLTRNKKGRLVAGTRGFVGYGRAGLQGLQDAYAELTDDQKLQFQGQFAAGKAAQKSALLGLVARDREAMDAWRTARAGIDSPTSPTVMRTIESYYADAAAGKGAGVRRVDQMFASAIQKAQLESPYALGGVMRDRLRGLRGAYPVLDIENTLEAWKFEGRSSLGRGDVFQAGIQNLEQLRSRYARMRRVPGARRGMPEDIGPNVGVGGFLYDLFTRETAASGAALKMNPDANPEIHRTIGLMIGELRREYTRWLQEQKQAVKEGVIDGVREGGLGRNAGEE